MTGLDIIFSIIMLGAIILVGISLFFESKTDIASVPTLPWVQKKMISALKKRFKPEGSYEFAELGSGWGSLVFGLANAFPNSSVHGYELSPIPYYVSLVLNKIFGDKNRVNIYKDDFFDVDLSQMDLVIFYLSGRHAIRLQDKLEAEMKPGAVVMSNSFPIPDWKPSKILKTKVFMELKVYVYVIPKKENAGKVVSDHQNIPDKKPVREERSI